MIEDRERLLTLRSILHEAGFDWDLTGDPPEIPASELSADDLRRTVDEIQRDFPATLAAIAAGKVEAPLPPENVGRFDRLSDSLAQIGVSFDGCEDPPDLAEVTFDSPEERELAEAYLAEMLADYPKTIAKRKAEGYTPMLLSMVYAEPYRDAPTTLPPLLKPRKPKN